MSNGECRNLGSTRWFYTGNQVGFENPTGDFNFCSGGPPGSGIDESVIVPVAFPPPVSRAPWTRPDASLSQELIDASFPFIDLVWFADITLPDGTLYRVSDRNVYVEDETGAPRFYEARVKDAPDVRITVGEWLSPNLEVGDLSLALNNRDGFFNSKLPNGSDYVAWTGTRIALFLGFGQKRANYLNLFDGFIADKNGLNTTKDQIQIRAYDMLDHDDVAIPANAFNKVAYPDLQDEAEGKAVPLVYGDWTTEVGNYAEIPAWVTNAKEELPEDYTLKISDNALSSIEACYLNRGAYKIGNPEGPIEIDLGQCTINLDRGEITVPKDSEIFFDEYPLLKDQKAGAGSAVNLITAEGNTNFIEKGVQPGDRAYVSFKATVATAVIGAIQIEAKTAGAIGNGLSVQFIVTPVTGPDGSPIEPHEPVVNLSGTALTVYLQYYPGLADDPGTEYDDETQEPNYREVTASKVASAINRVNSPMRAKVTDDTAIITASAGPVFTAGGQNATIQPALVTTVSNYQLTLSGGINFAPAVSGSNTAVIYTLATKRFLFQKGDKFVVRCVGKNVQRLSLHRLVDAGLGATTPAQLAFELGGMYWFADNAGKKLYRVGLDGAVKREIAFADLDPAITEITGVAWQTDNTLWIFDRPLSKIFRLMLDSSEIGLAFTTSQVTGLGVQLADGRGLTIDSLNRLYLVNNATGTFYRIDPLAIPFPLMTASWTRSAFDSSAIEILDLSADSNSQNMIVIDRSTGKLYRINWETGAAISSFPLSTLSPDITYAVGIANAQDGTLFVLNRSTMALYNYNDDGLASYNPGFIARDLLQSLAGKGTADLDLGWNQVCRTDLARFRARLYLSEKTTLIKEVAKLLGNFNTTIAPKFGKLALFHINFGNFNADGPVIREGDIREGTFAPQKEWNQYFNTGQVEYKKLPYTGGKTLSDNYISPSGLAAAGSEVNKKLDGHSLYRRTDVDYLMPLFVRLSCAEPEFVKMTVGFRQLFTQINDFFRIDFDSEYDWRLQRKRGGRRFALTPAFVREIVFKLSSKTMDLKLWSLGSTRFGDYIPAGDVAGGEGDRIVLTILGVYGYISPNGIITGSGLDSVTLADEGGDNAETRSAPVVGLAWAPGYAVAIVDGATHEAVGTATIDEVTGATVRFTGGHGLTITPTIVNDSGFITGGHYLRYVDQSDATSAQKDNYAFIGPPTSAYPTSTSIEIEEQKAGVHNFADGRPPYLLYPKDFTPN